MAAFEFGEEAADRGLLMNDAGGEIEEELIPAARTEELERRSEVIVCDEEIHRVPTSVALNDDFDGIQHSKRGVC